MRDLTQEMSYLESPASCGGTSFGANQINSKAWSSSASARTLLRKRQRQHTKRCVQQALVFAAQAKSHRVNLASAVLAADLEEFRHLLYGTSGVVNPVTAGAASVLDNTNNDAGTWLPDSSSTFYSGIDGWGTWMPETSYTNSFGMWMPAAGGDKAESKPVGVLPEVARDAKSQQSVVATDNVDKDSVSGSSLEGGVLLDDSLLFVLSDVDICGKRSRNASGGTWMPELGNISDAEPPILEKPDWLQDLGIAVRELVAGIAEGSDLQANKDAEVYAKSPLSEQPDWCESSCVEALETGSHSMLGHTEELIRCSSLASDSFSDTSYTPDGRFRALSSSSFESESSDDNLVAEGSSESESSEDGSNSDSSCNDYDNDKYIQSYVQLQEIDNRPVCSQEETQALLQAFARR